MILSNYLTDIFFQARIRLALYYTLAISFILVCFSLALYLGIILDLEADLRLNNQTEHFEALTAFISSGQLPKLIIGIDLVTIFLSALWGYWLAGLALKPVQQNIQSQRNFISQTSHDLRTPLTVMKADLEVTLKYEDKLTDGCQRSLKTTLEQVNKMCKIVEDLLSHTRSESYLRSQIKLLPGTRQRLQLKTS